MEKKLQDLSKELYMALIRLEKGELHLRDLNVLTDISREVYERLIALRYMALDKQVKGGSTPSFKLSGVHPGQTSLIDAIQEVAANEKSPDLFANLEEMGEILEQEEAEVETKDEVHDSEESDVDENTPAADFFLAEEPIETEDEMDHLDSEDEMLGAEGTTSAEGENEPKEELESEHEALVEQFEERDTNYKVKAEEATLAEKLSSTPIEDLRKAIGLNQKFQLIKEFFDGDADRYNAVIDSINGSSGFEEAMECVRTEIPELAQRDAEDEVAEIFLDLIERRFL